MQSMGQIMRTFMSELTSASEVGRRKCEGCGNEVVIIQMPIIGGPSKGKLMKKERGCVCWENAQAREAKRLQQALKVKQMIKKYSTVNPDLESATFENFKAETDVLKQALQVSQDYACNFDLVKPINLLFSGSYGLGKSHLSYAICKILSTRGYTTVFFSVPKLLTIIKSTYTSKSEITEAQLLDTLSKVDFLALDDIGAENASKNNEAGEGWAAEKLFEIIDGRSGRHTLYTTNLNSDELSKRVGKRNFSRMMMNTKPLRFIGDDYRIKNKMF